MKGRDPIARLSRSARSCGRSGSASLRQNSVSPLDHDGARPALRREEVAQLCGLSVTWYTWIEQGRDVSVSASHLRASRADCACHAPSAAICLKLRARRSERPGTGMIHLRGCWPASMRSMVPPTYSIAHGRASLERESVPNVCGWLDADGHNLLRYIFLRPEARISSLTGPSASSHPANSRDAFAFQRRAPHVRSSM